MKPTPVTASEQITALSRQVRVLSGHTHPGLAGGAYATPDRPDATDWAVGSMVYDTTLEKPIWWNGTVWKDSGGVIV